MATIFPTFFVPQTTTYSSSYSSASSTSSDIYGGYGPKTTTTSSAVPLTTQFQAPHSCFQDFRLGKLSVTEQFVDGYTTTNVTYLDGNITGTHSSCFPSGFGTATFYPGVCPSGWTYYTIHTQNAGGSFVTLANNSTAYEVRTSAACCASGFSATEKADTYPGSIAGCFREVEKHSTTIEALSSHTTSGGTATVLFTGGGYLRHEPLYVEWNERDQLTLSPSLPTLGDNKYIATWIPGGKVRRHKAYPSLSDSTNGFQGLFHFLIIGLPIIGCTIICCCECCCVRSNRKRRRLERGRREREERNAADEAQANLAALAAAEAAETRADAELAEAIEMVERRRANEAAGGVSPATSETPPPRHSFDGNGDEPLPPYSKKPPE